MTDKQRLARLDHAHLWHPFTPMRQWLDDDPLIIDRAEGFELIDIGGNRYIDGVSSLWCNVHGHRVAAIDNAVRAQLDKAAHTTLLGLSNPPAIELASKLVQLTRASLNPQGSGLTKVFYSDAGATALEVAFKMAVGCWHHGGRPGKTKFIGMHGAYHGDTTGSMSVGYSDLFHRPFRSMVFETLWFDSPDAARARELLDHAESEPFPSQNHKLANLLADRCIADLRALLDRDAEDVAAVVIEPVMQGAAGMICQPPGFVRRVADLAGQYDTLLIADEVATGFGRTGKMFACEHDGVTPDILCLAKGLTGGYLPVAATLTTQRIFDAFCGEIEDRRTLYHGHTYTGNPLGCAAALASIELMQSNRVAANAARLAKVIEQRLAVLRDHPHVLDVRQRGVMVGIELCEDRAVAKPFDCSRRSAAAVCDACRQRGLIIRPLGDVLILMPAPAMDEAMLHRLLDVVLDVLADFRS